MSAASRRLIGNLLFAALANGPALAEESLVRTSAVGEVRTSYLHLSDVRNDNVIQGGEASDWWTLGGAASVDIASGPLHIQMDFAGEDTLGRSRSDDTPEGSYGGGLHLNLRDPQRGSLGIFGALGKIAIHDEGARDPESIAWGVGAESQVFLDSVTVLVQAGYLDRNPRPAGDIDALKNAGFARIVARWFPCEDVRLAAGLGYAQGRMEIDRDTIFLLDWVAEAEARLPGTPIAGFARYSGARFDQSDDNDVLVESRITFGVRVYFGQPSLREHDRRGASLDLPRVLEWNGVIAGPLE